MKFGFDTNRTFGVEIEAYNVEPVRVAQALTQAGVTCIVESYNHSVRSYWKIVNDASIIGLHPFELVSPPLRGYEGLETLVRVTEVLNQLDVRVNRTTGLHVHHDAGGFNNNQLLNVALSYYLYYEHFKGIFAQSRLMNSYCQVLTPAVEDVRQAMNSGGRYYAVNLQAVPRHGTIEFRQHQGTTNAEKIVSWIIFTQQFMAAVSKRRTQVLTGRRATAPAMLSWLCQPEAEMTVYEQRALRYVSRRANWRLHLPAGRLPALSTVTSSEVES